MAVDDAGLTLPSVEEPPGLRGDFSPIPGPVAFGKAVLEVGIDQLVGVEFGRIGRQEMQLDLRGAADEPDADRLGARGIASTGFARFSGLTSNVPSCPGVSRCVPGASGQETQLDLVPRCPAAHTPVLVGGEIVQDHIARGAVRVARTDALERGPSRDGALTASVDAPHGVTGCAIPPPRTDRTCRHIQPARGP